MNSVMRFLTSTLIVAGLLFIALVLLVAVFLLGIGMDDWYRFAIGNLIQLEQADEAEIAKELAEDLTVYLQHAVIGNFGAVFCASLVWLIIANFMPVNKPGDAGDYVWAWIVILLLGAAGSVFVTLAFLIFEADFMKPSLMVTAIFISIIVFCIVYYFIGSVLATPKHMRTAVPFAARIFRR